MLYKISVKNCYTNLACLSSLVSLSLLNLSYSLLLLSLSSLVCTFHIACDRLPAPSATLKCYCIRYINFQKCDDPTTTISEDYNEGLLAFIP